MSIIGKEVIETQCRKRASCSLLEAGKMTFRVSDVIRCRPHPTIPRKSVVDFRDGASYEVDCEHSIISERMLISQ